MLHSTNDTVSLLIPLQQGVMNLQRRFPEWEEVRQLAENVAAVERRLAHVSPRLLNLVGKGTLMSIEEENTIITNAVASKYTD